MPRKSIIKDSVQELRWFGVSCRPTGADYQTNDCMNPDPPTQPPLRDVLIRSEIAPVRILGDVTKAFLQIEQNQSCRNTIRWVSW